MNQKLKGIEFVKMQPWFYLSAYSQRSSVLPILDDQKV